MKPGTKPKPTKLKALTTKRDHHKKNKDEPEPMPQIPEPPDFLNNVALDEWARVSVELYKLGLLAEIDRTALAGYCEAYSDWVNLSDMLAGEDLTHTNKNTGNILPNPLVWIRNKAKDMTLKFLIEFGMTPSSRSRVSAKVREESSPFEAWKRKGKNR